MSQPKRNVGPCSEAGCEKPAKTRGLCEAHYVSWWRSQNRERVLEKERQYREANAEKLREYHRQRYLANRDKVLERQRERTQSDPEYRERKRAAAAKWAKENPEKARENRRRAWAKRKYGLTLEEVEAILARGCAICGTHDGRVVGRRGSVGVPEARLCIDHDHTNGKVRDALCHSCNSGLGLFGDDPARLTAAAEYLESHRS